MIVRKNLMVRLAVPRFFRQGDEVVVSTIVHNYLATSKTVHVSLALKGLDILDGQTREIEVPSRGEAKLDWRVRAQSVSEADLLAKALTNEESDALELTLPVIPFGVKLNDAKSGSILAADATDDVTITLPGNPDQSAPSLDVTLSSSVAGSLFNALDYLTSYPYGCTEQTMSSFLPDIVVAKAMKDLHLQSTVDTPELEKKIAAGIERLKGFQHEDGGWGWWKDDDSRVFMTAYVVSGFGQAHAAGYDVDPDVLANAEKYLLTSLDRSPNMEPNLQAYVIYALALNNVFKGELTQATWEKRDAMNTQGLAMLGLALQINGETRRAKEIADKVASQVTESELEAYWPSSYDYLMGFEFDDNAETTAYAVQLLSRVQPSSALLPKAAFWLVNHRDGGYFWVSTKETAMVIFGLTDYVKASHELDANFKAELTINGKPALAHQFTSADSFSVTQPTIHLDAAQLHPGANTIHIHKSGTGRLYWSASGHYYSNEKRVIQQNKLSLNITRDYYRLSPEQVKDRIVYRLDPLAGELHVGDVVAVRVTVAGGDWHYLLIEDPIPAGAESISRDDLYEFASKPAWWERWYVSRELHDDRAAFFQTDFYGRHHEYVYLLENCESRKIQCEPRDGPAHVSAVDPGDHRRGHHRGEIMSRFEILHDAGSSLLHSKRVWLIQFVANPLLFALFVGWLLLPVATEFHLLLNGLVIVVFTAAALVLHAGTLNFYSAQHRDENAAARVAFGRAARNIFAVAACAALIVVLWALLDSTESVQLTLPFYVRSLLPEFIRRHLDPWWFQISLEGIVFAIRWVLIPGLVLPLLVEAANSGFRAFGKPGGAAVKNSAKRVSYWLVLLLAAVAGFIAPASLMEWSPEFKNPTLHLEAISLAARLSASYILAVASWLLVCSIVGRLSRPVTVTVSDASGNPAA